MKYLELSKQSQYILKNKEYVVIYHGGCDDGYAAAYAAWLQFEKEAYYMPAFYGNPPPYLEGKKVYILDFHFDKNILEEMMKKNDVILLDHHQSAYDKLKDVPNCQFDLEHSGAMIAWKHFHEIAPPYFFELIEDMDLWKFALPETKNFSIALRSYPKNFEVWDNLVNNVSLLIKEGEHISRYFNLQIDGIEKNATQIQIDNIDGWIVNANGNYSNELANKLASRDNSFGLVWYESSGFIKCSLRSTPNLDCRKIAEKFGGGGHNQASAFQIKSLKDFLSLKEKWELAFKLSRKGFMVSIEPDKNKT